MNRTIVALSTPPAHSAIAVVRLSGVDAITIADKIFRPFYAESLNNLPGYHAAYGEVFSDSGLVDEVVALVYRAPKSYTGENMVELSCHGNPLIAARLVSACIAAGAAPAGAGEFTKRAFENGKLDLSQAEAVAELIEAESELATNAAQQRRTGELGKRVQSLCDKLSFAAAQLAVWSDYPEEEDAPAITREELRETFEAVLAQLKELACQYNTGRLIQKGIKVAIAGSPNVGKSTLINYLSGSDRAIVTDIAGTTRDIIEAPAELDGITIHLLDTAGIRETGDEIERIGIKRAMDAIETSDLVLYLLDQSKTVTNQDRTLLEQVKLRPNLVVLNKTDLENDSFQHLADADVKISALTGEGIENLKKSIKKALGITLTQDSCLIASQRQFDCVLRSEKALSEAIFHLDSGVTLDVVGIMIEEAIAPLAELTGRTASQSVIEQVFTKFCVGK
ncbi:tRNA uridine-5-carboxymethylaminomethyl(34) synthesis GTPase MnmE [Oscillospiraceae bacterium LTW-04]|nr:tRNA uridine-5-carboxymethylaminomethyl(34) synthesis GTPase MnmE [Oscillospiraceae bacterium MB24-C1]